MLYIPPSEIERLLMGDYPLHDPTTLGLDLKASGEITAYFKTPGVLAGSVIAQKLFEATGCEVDRRVEDGMALEAKQTIMKVNGSARALHGAYKVAQCVMEYASGIATRTAAIVSAAREVNPKIQVAGTRKHMPGSKLISLTGLLAGGGIIHRANLSDSILVFDQHRVLASDVDGAMRRLIDQEPERKVAVEVSDFEEACHFARLGVGIVQCERFEPSLLTQTVAALKAINPQIVINAAGGVNAENAKDYASSGADVLVTSWPYFGKPHDVKMAFSLG